MGRILTAVIGLGALGWVAYQYLQGGSWMRGGTTGEPPLQIASVEVERLRPERTECWPGVQLLRPHEIERAEPPCVVERKAMPLVGLHQEVIVLLQFGRVDPPTARHAEMEDQRVAAIRGDRPVLRAAAEAGDASPRQPLSKIFGKRSAKVRAARLDARQLPPVEHSGKAADRRFDFGKLRHKPRMARARQGG